MATMLPYLASPGSIKICLEKIKAAVTPDRVTQDFVMTKLQIKGGTGAALIPYLKKIGFVASDGSPTDIYRRFRNHTTAGLAVASAIKTGYRGVSGILCVRRDKTYPYWGALVPQSTMSAPRCG